MIKPCVPLMSVEQSYPVKPPYRASSPSYSGLEQLEMGADDVLKDRYPRYFRFGTPTSDALNQALQKYESGFQSITTSSGLSAITTVLLALAKPKTKVVFNKGIYAPVKNFANSTLKKFDVECQFVSSRQLSKSNDIIDSNTSLVYLESPSSNVFDIVDFEHCIGLARKWGVPVVIDNTWATPLNFDPFKFGIDVSIHSASKYIGGHSDLVLGIINCSEKIYPQIRTYTNNSGQSFGSEEVYAAVKGFKTLDVRLQKQSQSAQEIVRYLTSNDSVIDVIKPDSPTHHDYELWKKYFSGSNGILSFSIDCQTTSLSAMLKAFKKIKVAYGWGGTETTIVPFAMEGDHPCYSNKYRYLRLSVGLEPVEVIISELEDALACISR